jgi:hypothetical protein
MSRMAGAKTEDANGLFHQLIYSLWTSGVENLRYERDQEDDP